MRNVFCVWALCAMLFCVAPGLAGAAPQLNEEALRSVVISRLGRVLTENGQDAVARKLLSDNVRIDKYQPVRVGVVDLYAVQLSLHHPDGSSQPNLPDRMTLLTDARAPSSSGWWPIWRRGKRLRCLRPRRSHDCGSPTHCPNNWRQGPDRMM